MALDKFVINKNTTNKYTVTIKQTGSTLPMEIITGDKTIDHVTAFTPKYTTSSVAINTEVTAINDALEKSDGTGLYPALDAGYNYLKYAKADVKKKELVLDGKKVAYQTAADATATARAAELAADNAFNAGLVEYNTLEGLYTDILNSGETGDALTTAKNNMDAQYAVVYGTDDGNGNNDNSGLDYALSQKKIDTATALDNEYDANSDVISAADDLVDANNVVLKANEDLDLVNNLIDTVVSKLLDLSVKELFSIKDAKTLALKKQVAEASRVAYIASITATSDIDTDLNTAKTAVEGNSGTMASIGGYASTIVSNIASINSKDTALKYTYTDDDVVVNNIVEDLEIPEYFKIDSIVVNDVDGFTVTHDNNTANTQVTFKANDTTTEMDIKPTDILVTLTIELVLNTGITADTFTAELIKLSDKTVVTDPAMTIVATEALQGKVEITIPEDTNDKLESKRGSAADKYYLQPTYKIVISADTNYNGVFTATIPEVYVD